MVGERESKSTAKPREGTIKQKFNIRLFKCRVPHKAIHGLADDRLRGEDNKGFQLEEQDGPSPIVTTTFDHDQDVAKIIKSLEKNKTHKVKIKDLLFFLGKVPAEITRPEVKLKYADTFYQDPKKIKEDTLKAFADFFIVFSECAPYRNNSQESLHLFDSFVDRALNLFEEFFPLPKKYSLFLKAISKEIYPIGNMNKFLSKCYSLRKIALLCSSLSSDIFSKPNKFLRGLKDVFNPEEYGFRERYDFLKEKVRQILSDIEKKAQKNKKEESQEAIKDRMREFAESTFRKHSDLEKRSFFEKAKELFYCFGAMNAKSTNIIRDIWLKARETIIKEDALDVQWGSVAEISGVKFLEVRKFLGPVFKERDCFLLRHLNVALLPKNEEIRRDVMLTAILNAAPLHGEDFDDLSNYHELVRSLQKLTEKDKSLIVHTDIQYEEGPNTSSVPLLVLLLTHSVFRKVAMGIVANLGPEVFEVTFKFNDEDKEYNIISLLERINDLCKDREKDMKEKNTSRSQDFSILYDGLDEFIGALKTIKGKYRLPSVLKKQFESTSELVKKDLHNIFQSTEPKLQQDRMLMQVPIKPPTRLLVEAEKPKNALEGLSSQNIENVFYR